MGTVLTLGVLGFMAMFHRDRLSSGAAVLGPNDLGAYGGVSAAGILLIVLVHEAGTLFVAWGLGLPLHFRPFGFGAHATAILESQPRRPWVDAMVALGGPVAGTAVSLGFYGIYLLCDPNDPHSLVRFISGWRASVILQPDHVVPILDLEEDGSRRRSLPRRGLFGLVGSVMELTDKFNLVLDVCRRVRLPRFILLIRPRAPRRDLGCKGWERWVVSIGYFLLVIALAKLGSEAFEELPGLVRDAMAD